MGTLWRNCTKVHKLNEQSFAIVSGVGSGIGVLDAFHVPQGEGEVSGGGRFPGPLV